MGQIINGCPIRVRSSKTAKTAQKLCAVCNCRYAICPNRRNFRVIKEIWVEEHDGGVRFKTINYLLMRLHQLCGQSSG